jgi:hypothetical protein
MHEDCSASSSQISAVTLEMSSNLRRMAAGTHSSDSYGYSLFLVCLIRLRSLAMLVLQSQLDHSEASCYLDSIVNGQISNLSLPDWEGSLLAQTSLPLFISCTSLSINKAEWAFLPPVSSRAHHRHFAPRLLLFFFLHLHPSTPLTTTPRLYH